MVVMLMLFELNGDCMGFVFVFLLIYLCRLICVYDMFHGFTRPMMRLFHEEKLEPTT